MMRRTAQDGEQADQQETERWHAGADNADVYLHGGPDGHVCLVKGGIQRSAQVDEEPEPYDADNRDASWR